MEIKNKITEMKNTTENFKRKISEKVEEKWKQNISKLKHKSKRSNNQIEFLGNLRKWDECTQQKI